MSFFSDALRRVGGALGLPVAEVEALVDDAVQRAEDIVRATGARVAGRILDAVEAAVPGIPVDEIAGDVSDTIASEVDGAVPDVDTIVLAEVERWRLAELRAIDPDLVLEFQAVLDDRTSPVCRACAGTRLRASDSWWDTHTPPLHPHCRSTVRPSTQGPTGRPSSPDARPSGPLGKPKRPWTPPVGI